MSEKRKVEVAIIGAGTSGMRAYREVSKVTDSVLLIEGDQYGTTCARVGCMPSKLLIAAAEAAHLGKVSTPLGVTYAEPVIDGRAVMQRVRAERDRFVGFVIETVEDWPAAHRLMGTARFLADQLLEVDGIEVEAERIVIATGSRPNVLPMFQSLGDRLIINDDIFYWDDLPESVAVFGAGVIGLELGQALSRLGVRVSLFGRNHAVGPLTDPAILESACDIFQGEFPFYPDAKIDKLDLKDGKAVVEFVANKESCRESFDYVLAATGRIPNIDRLGLEHTSVALNERGMPAFNLHTGQVAEHPIFIAGDVMNLFPILHEAADEGMIAGYNAAHYPNIRSFRKSSPIGVVFSDPQIMMVGQTHGELLASGIGFEFGELDWGDQGRSRVMLMNRGKLRVYGERDTGRFLGAEMIGPRAEHLAHLLVWAHQSGLTVSDMLVRPFYHPVFEEGVRTALRDLNYKLKMGPKGPARCMDCGPGS